MHEISIAESLIALIRRHIPTHERLISATVRIGPMHGVVSEAMEMAWNIASANAGWAGSRLIVVTPPWRLRCVACGRCWEPATVDEHCVCGGLQVDVMGGDEFHLDSIEVDHITRHCKPKHPAGRRVRAHGRRGKKSLQTGVNHEHQSTNC